MTDLYNFTTKQLLSVYNQISKAGLKRFSSKANAVARVQRLLEETGLTVENLHGQPVVQYPETEDTPKRQRSTFAETDLIVVNADKNPKRKGSKARDRFDLYRTHGIETVGDYLDACAKLQGDEDGTPRHRYHVDLHWDVKHGYIAVHPKK